MRLPLSALTVAVFAFAAPAYAMDGVNTDTGDAVTADDGTTFNVGDTVTLYDADGNEMTVQVQAVKDTGDALDVDVIDNDSGDSATIEFTK
jgi:uncharacterized protein YxjI